MPWRILRPGEAGIQSVRLRGPGKRGIRHSHALALFNLGRGLIPPAGACGMSLMKVTSGIPSIFRHSSVADFRAADSYWIVALLLQEASVVTARPLMWFLIVSHCLFFSHLAEMLALPSCPLALCLLLLLPGYYDVFNDSCRFPHRSGASASPSFFSLCMRDEMEPFWCPLIVASITWVMDGEAWYFSRDLWPLGKVLTGQPGWRYSDIHWLMTT